MADDEAERRTDGAQRKAAQRKVAEKHAKRLVANEAAENAREEDDVDDGLECVAVQLGDGVACPLQEWLTEIHRM